jgi:hypothetical protein
MKRLLLFGLGLFIFAVPSHAQSSFDASVGYSYFRLGGGADVDQNGISGSIAYKPILAGAGHVTLGDGGGSNTNFAYSFGGGVDVGVLPHLALRPQLDYVGLHNSGGTANCARVSISAVVRF